MFEPKIYKRDSLSARVELIDECFWVSYYRDSSLVGSIEYSNYSWHYVEDAVENWLSGILKEETIRAIEFNQ